MLGNMHVVVGLMLLYLFVIPSPSFLSHFLVIAELLVLHLVTPQKARLVLSMHASQDLRIVGFAVQAHSTGLNYPRCTIVAWHTVQVYGC